MALADDAAGHGDDFDAVGRRDKLQAVDKPAAGNVVDGIYLLLGDRVEQHGLVGTQPENAVKDGPEAVIPEQITLVDVFQNGVDPVFMGRWNGNRSRRRTRA